MDNGAAYMNFPPKVMLVNPPITDAQRRGPIGPVIQSLYFNSRRWACHLAAVLEREQMPVQIIDAAVENLRLEETVARIKEWAPDVIGLTSSTNFFCNALELAKSLKATLPSATIVLGGPHMTTSPKAALSHDCFDIGVRGEGEVTLLELLRELAAGREPANVNGLVYRKKNGELVGTPERALIENLDVLPMPARHLLPLKRYIPQPNDGPFLPKFAMITSRGCPYHCIFATMACSAKISLVFRRANRG